MGQWGSKDNATLLPRQCWNKLLVSGCAGSEICIQSLWNGSILAKKLETPIIHASVHIHDAESDTCMDITFKYNTGMIKLGRYNEQTVHFIFHQFGLPYTDPSFFQTRKRHLLWSQLINHADPGYQSFLCILPSARATLKSWVYNTRVSRDVLITPLVFTHFAGPSSMTSHDIWICKLNDVVDNN